MTENHKRTVSDEKRMMFPPENVTELETGAVHLGSTVFGWPKDAGPLPVIGDSVELETIRYSTITGIKVNGDWRVHRTDEYMDEQDRKFHENYEQEKRDRLAECRSEWIGHEEHLPNWAQRRLARFRTAGGETFELDGWGYELAICRLAAAYVEEGIPERGDYTLPPKVKALDEEMGCSGNQHDCARSLARLVIADREDDAAGIVPAGLSPLTGSADYSSVSA